MEIERKIISTYERYLKSLQDQDTDIMKNYKAMMEYICQSDNQVFKQHLYQDCHVNMLQAMRGWAERVKPGYAIKRAIDSNNPDGMEYLLTELKNHGSSCLPTLYYYFRPRNLKEVAEMEQELRDMSQLHYISEKHVWMIKNLVLQCREYRYRHQHDGSIV